MDKNTLLIMSAMLTSPFIAVWVQGIFNKRRTGAEIQNLNISGEISIGDAWKVYAQKQEDNTKDLRADFKELQIKFLTLSKEFETMKREKDAKIYAKDKKIEQLEHRIEILEEEIALHKKL